jgi:hypothetical protein
MIKPSDKVVSDLYPFTGLRMKDLEHAPSLDEVLEKVSLSNGIRFNYDALRLS